MIEQKERRKGRKEKKLKFAGLDLARLQDRPISGMSFKFSSIYYLGKCLQGRRSEAKKDSESPSLELRLFETIVFPLLTFNLW